ncbi:MAG TPA: hypothetical protein VK774_02890 [Solirubrobacteraceae bacterium]|nr:hypothetical protein [Solirubrobacteraceae bacterium]
MSRTIPALIGAMLSSFAFASSAAHAASPASVTVRVEGISQTLLAPTTVTTNSTPVEKDGNKEHTCAGGSAAGALELATSGNWSGEWFNGFGYSAEAILGELHAFEPGAPANYFWSYWLDNKASSVGICEGELSSGESILFFPECFSEEEPNPCPPPPNPLGIDAPQVVEAGVPFTASITSYANVSGAASPAAGATIAGGGAEATTDGSGRATITLSSTGNQLLRVTAPNSVRSEANVCVHKGLDGNCGAMPPANGEPEIVHPPAPAYKGPYAVVARTSGVAEGHVYAHGHAPQVLKGSVTTKAPIVSVSLELRRSYRGHCFAYNGTTERFQRAHCGQGSFFKVGSAPSFSYLLPAALAPGRYVLDVQAVDAAGNRTTLARGSSRTVFFVR